MKDQHSRGAVPVLRIGMTGPTKIRWKPAGGFNMERINKGEVESIFWMMLLG